MKKVAVEESIGTILCQDITKIVPGEFKGTVFKKGHIITEEDIPVLLNVGKEHLYVWDPLPGEIHENDAAVRISRAIAGENITFDENPHEGKCSLKTTTRGLFTLDSQRLLEANTLEYITIATLPNYYHVEEGQAVCGARVVPLLIDEKFVAGVEDICKNSPLLNVKPYRRLRCGVVTTGSEVYKGRIADKFGPVMKEKIDFYGGEFLGQIICPDDKEAIVKANTKFKEDGAELIINTGGMSVDPDDVTPAAIRATGANVITYGVPAQPGNMVLMAYWDNTAIVGAPGCAMFCRTTVVDVILPKIFTDIPVTKRDFAAMGEGGLCQSCENCRYPLCYFGR